jgi:hypothetical protein
VITTVVAAFLLIFLLAGVVGIMDNWRASTWREVAAERRMRWEARRARPATERVRRSGSPTLLRRLGGQPAVRL